MLMARVTTEGQVEVMLMSMGHATTRSHIDVYGLGCPLMSVAHVTTDGHGDVYGLHCYLKLLMSLAHPAN